MPRGGLTARGVCTSFTKVLDNFEGEFVSLGFSPDVSGSHFALHDGLVEGLRDVVGEVGESQMSQHHH